MSLFEYLAIAFSLVFSFSAVRLVSGLPYALEQRSRYLTHYLQVFNLLFATAAIFWVFWSFRDVEWNFFRFLFALASPGALYFLACTLIPDPASAVVSWRDHFYRIRRRLYIGVGAWVIIVAVNSTISIGLPVVHPVRVLQVVVLMIAAIGANTEVPWVHAAIAIGTSVVLVVTALLFFVPDALAV